MSEGIYLDHAATTPMRPEVRAALEEIRHDFGNPSSHHRWGRSARNKLEESRERLAGLLGASRHEITFTGGGTESDNLAILGRWRRWRLETNPGQGVGILACSAIEHRAVLGAVRAAEAEGASVILLGVDGEGVVDLGALDEALSPDLVLVSVMWANNEVGTIQPIAEIAERCQSAGVIFHSDAIQAFGRERIRVDEVGVDLLSLSSHKIGGPQGIGALYRRAGLELEPLIYGGGQEYGLRGGTEDLAAAVGFSLAAELAVSEQVVEAERLRGLRDRLQAHLLARIPDAIVNGGGAARLPQILNISIPGADRELLLISLDLEGIAVSTGSACRSGSMEPSHVLTAMGGRVEGATSLRLSLGRETTVEMVDTAAERIARVVERVRASS